MRAVRKAECVRSDAGFSLVEMCLSMILMLVVTGAVFQLVNPSATTSQTQPEAMDMQQRVRVSSDAVFRDLMMAGAGLYAGPQSGALNNFFAPIIPRKVGLQTPDAYDVARPDVITITYVPNNYSQTTIRDAMPTASAELKVNEVPNCPQHNQLCGFEQGMGVLIYDNTGNFDLFTITEVQNDAAHLQHRQQEDLSYAYQPGANITVIEQHTYYLDKINHQLRDYDGFQTDVPVADHVVGLSFEYFGDPNPPKLPKPPVGMENCLYDAAGNLKSAPVLATEGGSLAPLPLSILNNGPWCGSGGSRFDADLLRLRKVRVTVRVEATQDAFRANDTALFARPGTDKSALRYLPDYTATFEATPRNMNLGR